MNKECKRWLKQAKADLKASKDSLKAGNHEWSCFQAQQSAEKALKSYMYNLGYTSVITHSIKKLIKEAEKHEKSFSPLIEEARILDTYYIPTRYPNGLDEEMCPADYYDKEDAKKCISCATLILTEVKKYIKS